ncbi:hypothetical protein CEUSTIGMA_g7779.t1 [Chlamydomonas eustigma]|uniref:Uncharacterized protein n=1 Tax=Chlamydomonas eustigma TaxID=1157962 RepID=A0A250XB79_9CHLO|nr:hypothetical protein CEUSTIGMA_g7779.t1 [Chlamydomonas eustigma]|eukprot:GAX80341.1 hypothetical protein CEUSTIGMA_g7779.t1 [Chlamydomonas eustigma]
MHKFSESIWKNTLRISEQMRREVWSTETTTTTNPEELGWIGALCNFRMDQRTTASVRRCSRCQRLVIVGRLTEHAGHCSGASTAAVDIVQRAPKQASNQQGAGLRKHASRQGRSNSVSSSGSLAKMHMKNNNKGLDRGRAVWEDPLPRPQTNLSKMTFPYQPQISLLEDFMSSIIDRFVFPHHLKRSRTVKARRSRQSPFAGPIQGC